MVLSCFSCLCSRNEQCSVSQPGDVLVITKPMYYASVLTIAMEHFATAGATFILTPDLQLSTLFRAVEMYKVCQRLIHMINIFTQQAILSIVMGVKLICSYKAKCELPGREYLYLLHWRGRQLFCLQKNVTILV